MGNFSGKIVNKIRKRRRRRRRTIEKEMKRCLPSSFLLPLFLVVALLLFQSVARGGAALKIEAECSACRAVAVRSLLLNAFVFFSIDKSKIHAPRGDTFRFLSLSPRVCA